LLSVPVALLALVACVLAFRLCCPPPPDAKRLQEGTWLVERTSPASVACRTPSPESKSFRRRRGTPEAAHVGCVIRDHQRRNEQAARSHKKRWHRCNI